MDCRDLSINKFGVHFALCLKEPKVKSDPTSVCQWPASWITCTDYDARPLNCKAQFFQLKIGTSESIILDSLLLFTILVRGNQPWLTTTAIMIRC